MGPRRHRRQAPRPAVSIGAITGLDDSENVHSEPGPETKPQRNSLSCTLRTLRVSNKPRRGSLLKSSGQKLSNTSRKVSLLGSSII
jgi:hypothetical protein